MDQRPCNHLFLHEKKWEHKLVEGDGLEAPQKSLFYVVVHFHGH